VARYQPQTATFTTTQPAGAFGRFGNVWTHDYKVTINPCDNTFSGTGVEYGQDQNGAKTRNENVTGTFSADGTTSLVTTRNDGVDWSLTNAKTDGSGILVQLLAPAGPSPARVQGDAPGGQHLQEPSRLRMLAGRRLRRGAFLHRDADQQRK
jgi:hypothetical protein